LPGSDDRWRRQVEDLHLARVDVPVLERGQQAVVAGGHERYGDLLADQVGGFLDTAAVACNQRLGGADLRGDEEGLHRQLAGGGGGQRAGADVADLYVTGSDSGDHFSAAVELAPVDLGVGGLLVGTVSLGNLGRIDGGLVGNGEVGGLCNQGRARQGQCGQHAAHEGKRGHGVA